MRSLLLDFSEKSDVSHDLSSDCASGLTFQGEYSSGESKEKSVVTDEDNSSIWSIQVNTSITDDAEEIAEENEQDDYYEDDGEQQLDCSFVDELCNGIENMFVNKEKVAAKFEGKHTRFVYDSDDDEIVSEEEEDKGMATPPGGVLRLNGMPTPRGKHTRFPEEEEAVE